MKKHTEAKERANAGKKLFTSLSTWLLVQCQLLCWTDSRTTEPVWEDRYRLASKQHLICSFHISKAAWANQRLENQKLTMCYKCLANSLWEPPCSYGSVPRLAWAAFDRFIRNAQTRKLRDSCKRAISSVQACTCITLATLFSILIRFSFDSKQIWHVYHKMTASPVGTQAACPNIL